MKDQISWATGKPGAEDALLSAQIRHRGPTTGRLATANDLSKRAVDSAKPLRCHGKPPPNWLANEALREAEFGNIQAAKTSGPQKLWLSATAMTPRFMASLGLRPVAGEVVKAQQIADKLGPRLAP